MSCLSPSLLNNCAIQSRAKHSSYVHQTAVCETASAACDLFMWNAMFNIQQKYHRQAPVTVKCFVIAHSENMSVCYLSLLFFLLFFFGVSLSLHLFDSVLLSLRHPSFPSHSPYLLIHSHSPSLIHIINFSPTFSSSLRL